MTKKSRYVVSPEWLADRLGQKDVSIVDASWYLPVQQRDAKAEYRAGHIPGAVFFDLDAIADHGSGLPHMLASPEDFAAAVGPLGISETDTIIVYDGLGLFSGPRAWWNFRVMGADRTFLLDGDLPAWIAAGLPVTAAVSQPSPKSFRPTFDPSVVSDMQAVLTAVEDGSAQIVDARPGGRFTARDPEPREGMRSGHIPNSRNVPFTDLQEAGRLKDLEALRELFRSAGVDLTRPIITTCGSGVTAATLSLALMSLDHSENAIYDGSWTEWGGTDVTPVATGAA